MKTTWTSLLLVLPLAVAMATELKAPAVQAAVPGCSGAFEGTWNFRDGRPMSVELSPLSEDRAKITLRFLGLETPIEGTCVADEENGSVVSFNGLDENGLTHSGALYLEPAGHLSGAIDGYAFTN